MGLRPTRTRPDAPLQRPRGVREIKGQRTEDGLYRDAADHGAGGEHRQRGPKAVAADVSEEDPCPERVPGEESQRAGCDRSAAGGKEHIMSPRPEKCERGAADHRVRGGNAVNAVHEVERVHEGGHPQRDDGHTSRPLG
jgi:hypothetical protein